MTSDARLDDLLLGVYAWLLSKTKAKVDPEALLRSARKIAEHLLHATVRPVSWEEARPTSVRYARSPAARFQPVRVRAQITRFDTPELLMIPGDDGGSETLVSGLTLTDARGDEIETLSVVGEELIRRLEDLRETRGGLEFLAQVITVPRGLDVTRQVFVLEVFDARCSPSALDLVAATVSERREAEELLAQLSAAGEVPVDFLLEEIVEGLNIVGLHDFPLLRQLLRAVVLQSLSCGYVSHSSARLHLMVAGPPGVGKKLLGLAARVLNPVCQEASAAKISAAGLVGANHISAKGWTCKPGLIPLADEGVLVLQDAHGITVSELRKIGPVLQELIEDGAVRNSTAGGRMRQVSVGLVLDLNQGSQLTSGQKKASEAPILTLRPLLSRVDILADIPDDPHRAWDIGAQLFDVQSTATGPLEEQPWVRPLRLLVATLRDRYPVIDIGPVRATMKESHRRIAAENHEHLQGLPEAGDLPVRLAVSFSRLVLASARGHDRSVATIDDVEEALDMLGLKLRFFRLHAPTLRERTNGAARDTRWEYYRGYQGDEVRSDDLARAYTAETGEAVSERTVRRDLRQLGAKRVGKGLYLLPPPSESR